VAEGQGGNGQALVAGGGDGSARTYRQEDVQEILQLALAKRGGGLDDYSRSQLLEMALELGITAEDLAAAEQVWQDRQGDRGDRALFVAAEKQRLKLRLGKGAIVSVFLLLMDWVTADRPSWSLIVLLGWGLVISLDAWKSLQPGTEDFNRRLAAWQALRRAEDDWT
jgi:hypothetical protein